MQTRPLPVWAVLLLPIALVLTLLLCSYGDDDCATCPDPVEPTPAGWFVQNTPATESLSNMHMFDAHRAIAAGGGGTMIRTTDDGGDKVNIRVPIGLIRTVIKLSTLVPLSASEHLTEHGIDLSQFNGLDGDALEEALRELRVDVDTEEGGVVRVFCE